MDALNLSYTDHDFHNATGLANLGPLKQFAWTTEFTYTFQTFFHPFVGELIGKLNEKTLQDMLDPVFLTGLQLDYTAFYKILQKATGTSDRIAVSIPPGIIETSSGGAYSLYNWELFYHIPVMIAVHLTQNQRFAEAQNWFHLVFDPTFTDASSNPSYPFWKFLGFRQPNLVENLVDVLSYTGSGPTMLAEKQALMQSYNAILTTPFDPHAVARTRPLAYMYYVVMKYLDNLIGWGDSLFGGGKPADVIQPTIETINEATLCYVLAANLLGPRPQELPQQTNSVTRNYQQLQAAGMDAMGNALVDLEVQFPFNLTQPPSSPGSQSQSGALFGIAQTLYFCIPPNQTLLGYWDLVADRLFKIRNCENIQGGVLQLPLFDPPIDPGMLVQAAAAGINIGSAVSGLNQPLGPVRSTLLIQRAIELANEVRTFGAAWLAVQEKGDAEHLAALRQSNDVILQQAAQSTKFLQWQQAREATQVLLRSRNNMVERYTYYLSLLGLAPNTAKVPASFDTTTVSPLTEDNFATAYQALVAQYDLTITPQTYPSLDLAQTTSPSTQSGASSSGQLYLNKNEDTELNSLLPTVRDTHEAASTAIAVAGVLTLIPEVDINLEFWGIGGSSKIFGGSKLSDLTKVGASVLEIIAGHAQDQAGMASRTATYQRRVNDWTLQANLAGRDLMQMGRQILGSLIGEQVASQEYQTAITAGKQSQATLTYLQNKFSNEQLYLWMQGQLSNLFYQYYRFAVDTAHQAEMTMKQELMRPELDQTTFIQSNYWDATHQGLLAGEALHLDLKRMEMAYYQSNTRELEITRHVSLRQLDPQALIQLRATGQCSFTVPEWLFDRDCPGVYMRRIKTVAVTIPSVVGPYTSVNCMLTLESSTVRTSSTLSNNKYARQPDPDDRFIDYYGSNQAIVTSTATNDSGMFETNLHDERFLPFEGQGAINSTWTAQLPSNAHFPAFDYSVIPDFILSIRHTGRLAGQQVATACTNELLAAFKPGAAQPLTLNLLFMLKNDFPTQWAAFVNSTAATPAFQFTLLSSYFPYAVQGMKLTLLQMRLYSANLQPATPQPDPSTLPPPFTPANASANISIPADGTALTQNATQVYLIFEYAAS
jgi:hypothetical protein